LENRSARSSSTTRKSEGANGGLAGEMDVLTRQGERMPIEIYLSHLRDKKGDITGITGIFRDITAKREMEVTMRRMDKLASLGQLASGIAHEIKNPLTGIGSAVQVLFSTLQLDDAKKEIVNEILKQIHRLDETIKNMLRFAKPGKPQLLPTEPREIIDAVFFLISQKAKERNIEVRLNLEKQFPKVMIDPQQVHQAILNVVLNAMEAMPSGGVLSISLEENKVADSSRKEKPYFSITVSDTGAGIPDKVMAQIFNPFFTTKASGTGLGLSITQRIIEQHNGKIEIRSAPGSGTSFTISFPMEQGYVE
jgi:two-component system NtrC family sensor kinase